MVLDASGASLKKPKKKRSTLAVCMCVAAVQKDGLTVARSQIERRKNKTKQELMSQFDVGRKEREGERGI